MSSTETLVGDREEGVQGGVVQVRSRVLDHQGCDESDVVEARAGDAHGFDHGSNIVQVRLDAG